MVTPSAIPGAIRSFGVVAGLAGVAAIGTIIWSLLWCARRLHLRRPPIISRWSWVPAGLVYLVTGLTAACVPMVTSTVQGRGFLEGWAYGGQALLILTPVAALGSAIVFAEDRRRTMAEREREAAVAQAEWMSQRLQQEAWAASHMLARELHGGVQSELTAAALRLEAWAQSPDPRTKDEVLDQVMRAVDRVQGLAAQEFKARSVDPEQALAGIIGVWSQLSSIDLRLDETSQDMLSRDPSAAEAAVEVIRECLGNALRHGRATHVDIRLEALDEQRLRITVVDDGRGMSGTPQDGFGSRLLHQICLSWTRQPSAAGGLQVQAVLAVTTEDTAPADRWRSATA